MRPNGAGVALILALCFSALTKRFGSEGDAILNPSSRRILFDLPSRYRIRVQGSLSVGWASRLEDMTIVVQRTMNQQQVTILTCEVRDQAALRGVLDLLYDMRLPLLKVERLGLLAHAEYSDQRGETT